MPILELQWWIWVAISKKALRFETPYETQWRCLFNSLCRGWRDCSLQKTSNRRPKEIASKTVVRIIGAGIKKTGQIGLTKSSIIARIELGFDKVAVVRDREALERDEGVLLEEINSGAGEESAGVTVCVEGWKNKLAEKGLGESVKSVLVNS